MFDLKQIQKRKNKQKVICEIESTRQLSQVKGF